MQRRAFLRSTLALTANAVVSACAGNTPVIRAQGQVVIVGGGFGGATAAKYLRLWSGGTLDVTLVETQPEFLSCPMSNLVLSGVKDIAYLTHSYDSLVRQHGVKRLHERALEVDPERHRVKLAGGTELAYDRLILAPGIDFMPGAIEGLDQAAAEAKIPHAWKAGPQTLLLRRQLEAMADGGVFAIAIPLSPYRCPPAPYERACQVAWYFKQVKPKSKVLIFDANDDVQSKAALFKQAWADEYRGMVEYRPNYALTAVDAATITARFDVQDPERVDVLNVIPPQRAAAIARSAGVVTANDRWCEVDFLSFESIKVKNVHVLGDALLGVNALPKSGFMANQQAKVCASAILALLSGQAPDPQPVLSNACYSFLTADQAVHVCSVHRYDTEKKTLLPVPEAGGLSAAMSRREGDDGFAWAQNIWADSLR